MLHFQQRKTEHAVLFWICICMFKIFWDVIKTIITLFKLFICVCSLLWLLYYHHNWAVPGETQHYRLCVMYRSRSACAGDRGIELWFLKQKIHRRRNVFVRVSLRARLRLIRVDTFRSQQFWFSGGTAPLYFRKHSSGDYVISKNKYTDTHKSLSYQ